MGDAREGEAAIMRKYDAAALPGCVDASLYECISSVRNMH